METAKTRVLLFDVETSPNIGFTWGKWEQNVIEFIKERQIISFAWKWLDEKETHVRCLADYPGYKKNRDSNKALMVDLHALMAKADIIVAHNGAKFDERRANTDFIKHGLTPPPPHKTVDTLRAARSRFDFNSNKLDDLAAFLGVGRKLKHWGFELWRRCMEGDPEAWALMKRYNVVDVQILERVYLRVRPWMTNHPNMNAADKHTGCPACRSMNRKIHGRNISKWGTLVRYRCLEAECGKTYSGKVMKSGEWRFS